MREHSDRDKRVAMPETPAMPQAGNDNTNSTQSRVQPLRAALDWTHKPTESV